MTYRDASKLACGCPAALVHREGHRCARFRALGPDAFPWIRVAVELSDHPDPEGLIWRLTQEARKEHAPLDAYWPYVTANEHRVHGAWCTVDQVTNPDFRALLGLPPLLEPSRRLPGVFGRIRTWWCGL
jgi:hypothetical protein